MEMGKILTFETPRELPIRRDATEYRYPFRMVDSNFVGAPEEIAKSTQHTLIVGVSGPLEACWQLPKHLLPRILFEYGRLYPSDTSNRKSSIRLYPSLRNCFCTQ